MKSEHGDVCFYKECYAIRTLKLPMCRTMEVLGVHVHGAATNLLIVVVYRSGSVAVNMLFFDEFADLIERVAAFVAPIVIIGDINLHLHDPSASMMASFNDIHGGADLTQHVTGATHRAGYTLDVLIIQSDAIVSVTEYGVIFDHPLIIANIVPGFAILTVGATVIRRQWMKFNEVTFRKDLAKSDLITSPPTNGDEYCACYDDTLRRMLNVHAPLRLIEDVLQQHHGSTQSVVRQRSRRGDSKRSTGQHI